MNIELKAIIKEYNILQKELAVILKVKESTASNYVTGARKLSLEKLILLADYLQVPLDTLVKNSSSITLSRKDLEQIKYHQRAIDEILKKYK